MNLNKLEEAFGSLEFTQAPKASLSEINLSQLTPPHLPVDSALVVLKDGKSLKQLASALSSAPANIGVITTKTTYEKEDFSQLGELLFVCIVEDANLALCKLSEIFFEDKTATLNHMVDGRQMGSAEVDPSAEISQAVFIGEGVQIGAGVKILPGCTILAHCRIGEGTVLYPNVTLYPFVELGKNCRIHSGTVIGSDGYGYHFHQGVHHKIWHMGGAKLGNDVEVGANSCIDGGTFSPTQIGDGCKFDNLVQVGHNCEFGRGVILCGQVAIGGSSSLGDFCVFGGKSGMGDHMKLGMGCQVAGGALVNNDWPDGSVLGGHPARPLKEWMKGLAYLRKESLKKK